jgi:6-pyruvoyltetrahydropterin/6-carboxytetrahydropterin synthase
MYSVLVRDHVMIAHSFTGAVFGPAQRLHGATYIVDVEFRRAELDPDGVVVDIGLASEVLRALLATVNFRNLDEVPEFKGRNTTTEFMARYVFDNVARAIAKGDLGPNASGIESVKVTLHESHIAAASYESPLVADRLQADA